VATGLIATNTASGTTFTITPPAGGNFYVNSVDTILSQVNGAAQTVSFNIGDSGSSTKYFTSTAALGTNTKYQRTSNQAPLNATSPVVTNLVITTSTGFPATAGGSVRVLVSGYYVENDF
jgi:hypothetical protein